MIHDVWRARYVYRGLLLVLMFSAVEGCMYKTPVEAPTVVESPLPDPESLPPYRLQPGDQLSIKFWDTPELDEDIVVRPDGRISLPFIDEVVAAGLTPSELDGELTERYRSELKRPEITVIVRQSSGQRVFVGGEVGNQGVLDLDGRLTLFQAVQEAGGLLPSARLSQVLLIRHLDDRRIARAIDMRPIVSGLRPEDDVELRPYDIVFVPRTKITDIGLFVDQYINDLIPNNALFNVPFFGDLRNTN